MTRNLRREAARHPLDYAAEEARLIRLGKAVEAINEVTRPFYSQGWKACLRSIYAEERSSMSHNHEGEQLTTGCSACIERASLERWNNAPTATVHWLAEVPTHVATHDDGKPIRWRFTTSERVPVDVLPDELEDLELRCDIGAAMCETMPILSDDTAMDALATAECSVTDIVRQPAPTCETLAMF